MTTSQRSEEAENALGSAVQVLSVLVPSGRVRVSRTKGVSGDLGEMKGGLVWNSTVRVEPSSRWASQYHHSNVPAAGSVRSPSSQGWMTPGVRFSRS